MLEVLPDNASIQNLDIITSHVKLSDRVINLPSEQYANWNAITSDDVQAASVDTNTSDTSSDIK